MTVPVTARYDSRLPVPPLILYCYGVEHSRRFPSMTERQLGRKSFPKGTLNWYGSLQKLPFDSLLPATRNNFSLNTRGTDKGTKSTHVRQFMSYDIFHDQLRRTLRPIVQQQHTHTTKRHRSPSGESSTLHLRCTEQMWKKKKGPKWASSWSRPVHY